MDTPRNNSSLLLLIFFARTPLTRACKFSSRSCAGENVLEWRLMRGNGSRGRVSFVRSISRRLAFMELFSTGKCLRLGIETSAPSICSLVTRSFPVTYRSYFSKRISDYPTFSSGANKKRRNCRAEERNETKRGVWQRVKNQLLFCSGYDRLAPGFFRIFSSTEISLAACSRLGNTSFSLDPSCEGSRRISLDASRRFV